VRLTEAQHDAFRLLVRRPFLVLDTEYTPDPDGGGNRIISIAVVPVVNGRREARRELYREMDPGVPIHPRTTAVHGFTDDDVAGKRGFAWYAPAILAALHEPDAVLVQHTAADVRALLAEMERLGGATAEGVAVPELPIIDTSTLPRLLRYPGVSNRGPVSLTALCQLTGVTNAKPHDARHDARATADALLELLAHTAREGSYLTLEDLLRDHDQGTIREPRGPAYIRSSRPTDPVLPAEHLTRHGSPLTHAVDKAELAAWVDLAVECATLRCPYMRDEARVAAEANGTALLDRLVDALPALGEPGQAGTLLGAVQEFLAPPAGAPALTHTWALRWWWKVRPQVQASPACTDRNGCPHCREFEPCPRDTLYQPVTRIATLGGRTELDRLTIHDKPFGHRPERRIHKWRDPEVAAYMAWMVVTWEEAQGSAAPAAEHLAVAMEKDLHLVEPRLALLACEFLASTGDLDGAEAAAEAVLAKRTTDDGYTDLATWLTWNRQALAAAARKAASRVISNERLARPPGRVNANPYALG
jgi:DNA polymerase III epsilon subunit-like protein